MPYLAVLLLLRYVARADPSDDNTDELFTGKCGELLMTGRDSFGQVNTWKLPFAFCVHCLSPLRQCFSVSCLELPFDCVFAAFRS